MRELELDNIKKREWGSKLMYSALSYFRFLFLDVEGGDMARGESCQVSHSLPQLIFTPDHSMFAEKFPRDFKSFSISWIKKVVRELKQQKQIISGWGEFYKSASVFGKSQHQNSLILSTSSLRKSYQNFPASENTFRQLKESCYWYPVVPIC